MMGHWKIDLNSYYEQIMSLASSIESFKILADETCSLEDCSQKSMD